MNLSQEISTVLAVGTAFLGMFAITETWRRLYAPHAELTRKLAHVIAGVITLSFPLLFQSPWTVMALAAVFVTVLLLARNWRMLRSINGIDRQSYGEVYFPGAIACTFLLASYTDTYELYVISVGVLAVSDALAGLIGQRWGRHPYRIGHATKSVEGSAAFLLSAIPIVSIGLAVLLDLPPATALAFGGLTAVLMTALEAVMPFGTDNAVLPTAAWLVLLALVG